MKKIYLNAQTQVVELEMDNAIMLYSKEGTQQEILLQTDLQDALKIQEGENG